jgi:hypothetical protein
MEHNRVPRDGAASVSIAGEPVSAASIFRRLRGVDARTAWVALLGAALVVLIGVPLAAALNIWIDEAFTLHTTGSGPLYAWAQAIAFERQPPLYFVLEAAWRRWDETSIAFARLPSVLFAAAAAAVIVTAAHRIVPRVPSVVVVLMTSLNPLVIWAAVEMRVYALVLLVGAVLTWTFFEGFLVSQPSRRARVWYVVFAIVGLYTQYYVGFVLAAHFITSLALRRGSMRALFVSMVIVAVAFAPFVPVAMMHVANANEVVTRATFVHAVHAVANAVFVFVLPHDEGWTGAVKLVGFALAAALIVTLFVAGRPAAPTEPARAVMAQWFGCIAVFSVVFGTLGLPLEPLRHLVVVAPSSLLVALLFMSSLTRMRRLTVSLAASVFVVFALGQFWAQYHPPLAKLGDWQRVAATLSADDQSTPIAVFAAEWALPLSVYLPVSTIPIPIPRPMPFTLDYVRATSLAGEFDVAHVLDPVAARSQRLWLVTNGEPCRRVELANYNYHCYFLEDYMTHRYQLVRSVVFRGALARLYTRRRSTGRADSAIEKSMHAMSR